MRALIAEQLDPEFLRDSLNSIKTQTSKLTFDGSNRLYVNAAVVANPSNLDVALSTRASESTLSSVLSKLDSMDNALASVGTDKFRVSIIDSLPSGDNWVGRVKIGDGSHVAEVSNLGALYVCRGIPRSLLRTWSWSETYSRLYMQGETQVLDTGAIDRAVTETSYTEKLTLFPNWDFPYWDTVSIAVWPRIKGYIDTSGETLYVRVRGKYTGKVYGTNSYTETSETWKGFGEFWVDPRDLYRGYGLAVEAYVTGGTGHITEVQFHLRTMVPPSLLVGHDYDNYRPRTVRVTSDGKVVCWLG